MRQAVLVGRKYGRAVSPAPPSGTVVPRPRPRRFRRHPPRPARALCRLVALLIGVSLALIATIWEAQTSELQSRFFGHWISALSGNGIHPIRSRKTTLHAETPPRSFFQ